MLCHHRAPSATIICSCFRGLQDSLRSSLTALGGDDTNAADARIDENVLGGIDANVEIVYEK